jgi:hypothetical protein
MSTTTYTLLKKALLLVFALILLLLLASTYFSADALYHQPLHPVEAADNGIILPPTVAPLAPLWPLKHPRSPSNQLWKSQQRPLRPRQSESPLCQ